MMVSRSWEDKMSFLWTTFWGKILMTFLFSMSPILELRGSIPLAAAHGLPPAVAIPVAILGNTVPVPFVILFIRRVFAWIRRHAPRFNHMVDRLEEKGKNKQDAIQKSAFWGLFFLVAIPLPGTGAWTGALVAAMLDMRLKRAFPAIFLGLLAASVIVSLVTYGVASFF